MTEGTVWRLHTHEPVVSDGAIEFLTAQSASLAVAAGGRLWLFTTDADGRPAALELGLEEAAAVAWHDGRLWVATAWQVWTFVDTLAVAEDDESDEHVLLPQAAHTTGHLAVSDLAVSDGGPLLVSGLFTCLATLDDHYSMRPVWVPPGLGSLRPETRWLLTGVALRDGLAAFVTAAGRSDDPQGWRAGLHGGGLVMSTNGDVVTTGLTVPRHPRWHRGGLIVAESGTGRVLRVDPSDGGTETITTLPGALGGMTVVGDVALVGHGHPDRAAVEGLPGGPPSPGGPVRECISLVDLRSGSVTGTIEFLGHAGPVHALAVLSAAHRSTIAAPRGLMAQSTVVVVAERP